MSGTTPNLPDPPSVEQIRRDMENVRQQNDRLSQDQINMIVGAEKIRGDIRTINLQLGAIWTVLLATLGGAVFLAWTVYTRLDDKIDKNYSDYLQSNEKLAEKVDNAADSLADSIDAIRTISKEINNQKKNDLKLDESIKLDNSSTSK